jgi:hypothetical protein
MHSHSNLFFKRKRLQKNMKLTKDECNCTPGSYMYNLSMQTQIPNQITHVPVSATNLILVLSSNIWRINSSLHEQQKHVKETAAINTTTWINFDEAIGHVLRCSRMLSKLNSNLYREARSSSFIPPKPSVPYNEVNKNQKQKKKTEKAQVISLNPK